MKVLNPMMSTSASGSITGVTYANWRGLPTVRRKSVPVRRLRSVQPTRRSMFAYLARYWGGLTVSERANWRTYATGHPLPDGFGGTVVVSGFNMFMRVNTVQFALGFGLAPILNPPVVELEYAIATISDGASIVAGNIDVDWTLAGAGLVGDKVEVGISNGRPSAGVLDSFTGFKIATTVSGTTLTATITGLVTDMYYQLRVRYVSADGEWSPYLYIIIQAT